MHRTRYIPDWVERLNYTWIVCWRCDGTGYDPKRDDEICPTCGGDGGWEEMR